MTTVVVGGSRGIGLEVARRRVVAGDQVILTSRDAATATAAAQAVSDGGGAARGIALDLSDPHAVMPALTAALTGPDGLQPVDRVVLAAIERDTNTVAGYDIDRAVYLATLKLVGYTEVIHALVPALHDDSAVVVFGGRAKDRPYPGSITVSTVNGGVVGLVHAMALELAPVRVNGIHPGVVGDSPFWAAKPSSVLDGYVARTPTGRLATVADVVDAVEFLLGNRSVNGIHLYVDGGWLVT